MMCELSCTSAAVETEERERAMEHNESLPIKNQDESLD